MTITEKIQSWCNDTLTGLVAQYDTLGRRASGNWERDLESDIERSLTGFRIRILGSYYSYWMENGRKPGKFPPIDAIRQWIDDKGIIARGISRNSLAFLIARKIAREGYQGRPLVTSVVTDEWIKDLLDAIDSIFIEEIRSEVINEFKKVA